MIIKEKFDLLKGVDNIINLPASKIRSMEIENGPRKIFVVLELMKNRISHYTKDSIFSLISGLEVRKKIHVVNMPSYSLPITYNKTTDGQIINLSALNIDDIVTDKPGPQNLYALLVYSIVFSDLVSGRFKISDKYATPITNYFVSIFLRLFGKEYGLLGSFSSEINKLKFLTNLYVLTSFFGITGIPAYKRASASATFDYKKIEDKLKRYDFKNINDFILSLSELGVMPNLNRHVFTQKVMRQFGGLSFLPALEDCSRFIATLSASEIKGSNIVSTYLYKYNERDFNQILEITKALFRRRK
jgi:hypothetical protein